MALGWAPTRQLSWCLLRPEAGIEKAVHELVKTAVRSGGSASYAGEGRVVILAIAHRSVTRGRESVTRGRDAAVGIDNPQ